MGVAQRRDTIPITGRLDGQGHDMTVQNMGAGQGTRGVRGGAGNPADSRPAVRPLP